MSSPQAAMFKVAMFKTHPPIPSEVSEKCKAFIKGCFEPNPKERPDAIALLQDGFIQQYHHNISRTRSGSINKKPLDTVKQRGRSWEYQQSASEMLRSTSHIGGMGFSDRPQEQATSQSATASKEEKKLHLMITDTSRVRTFSASPVPDGPPSAGTESRHPGFHLSQPSSPIIDDNTHPNLTHSSMSSTGISLLNRTISDESHTSSRFFMLKKDSERRSTLAQFFSDYKDSIIESWEKRIEQQTEGEVVVSTN